MEEPKDKRKQMKADMLVGIGAGAGGFGIGGIVLFGGALATATVLVSAFAMKRGRKRRLSKEKSSPQVDTESPGSAEVMMKRSKDYEASEGVDSVLLESTPCVKHHHDSSRDGINKMGVHQNRSTLTEGEKHEIDKQTYGDEKMFSATAQEPEHTSCLDDSTGVIAEEEEFSFPLLDNSSQLKMKEPSDEQLSPLKIDCLKFNKAEQAMEEETSEETVPQKGEEDIDRGNHPEPDEGCREVDSRETVNENCEETALDNDEAALVNAVVDRNKVVAEEEGICDDYVRQIVMEAVVQIVSTQEDHESLVDYQKEEFCSRRKSIDEDEAIVDALIHSNYDAVEEDEGIGGRQIALEAFTQMAREEDHKSLLDHNENDFSYNIPSNDATEEEATEATHVIQVNVDDKSEMQWIEKENALNGEILAGWVEEGKDLKSSVKEGQDLTEKENSENDHGERVEENLEEEGNGEIQDDQVAVGENLTIPVSKDQDYGENVAELDENDHGERVAEKFGDESIDKADSNQISSEDNQRMQVVAEDQYLPSDVPMSVAAAEIMDNEETDEVGFVNPEIEIEEKSEIPVYVEEEKEGEQCGDIHEEAIADSVKEALQISCADQIGENVLEVQTIKEEEKGEANQEEKVSDNGIPKEQSHKEGDAKLTENGNEEEKGDSMPKQAIENEEISEIVEMAQVKTDEIHEATYKHLSEENADDKGISGKAEDCSEEINMSTQLEELSEDKYMNEKESDEGRKVEGKENGKMVHARDDEMVQNKDNERTSFDQRYTANLGKASKLPKDPWTLNRWTWAVLVPVWCLCYWYFGVQFLKLCLIGILTLIIVLLGSPNPIPTFSIKKQ